MELERNTNNQEVFRLAAELGKALKEDARMKALAEAKAAYESDVTVQGYLAEYEADGAAITEELTKENKDMMAVERLQARTEELYRLITEAPSFLALNAAQKTVNDLMETVNNTITFFVTGEMPTCTHDCSTCGGGCKTSS